MCVVFNILVFVVNLHVDFFFFNFVAFLILVSCVVLLFLSLYFYLFNAFSRKDTTTKSRSNLFSPAFTQTWMESTQLVEAVMF